MHSGESLGPGLLAKVLRDVEITRNELEELGTTEKAKSTAAQLVSAIERR